MDMGTQGSGRKRLPNRERLTAEDDALNQIAREVSEARPQLSAYPAVPSRAQWSPAAALWAGPQERWAPAFIHGLRTTRHPPHAGGANALSSRPWSLWAASPGD